MDKYVIGLVGGIASGKSFVANILKEKHYATIIDVDKIAHRILETDKVTAKLKKKWGKSFIDIFSSFSSKKKDYRRAMANIIFNDEKKLKFFNRIMKRFINKEVIRTIKETNGLIILDMPLLFESKMQRRCNSIWFINTDRQQRILNFSQRYVDSNKSIDQILQDFESRESRQISCEIKEKLVDQIVNNHMKKDKLIELISEFIKDERVSSKLRFCRGCKWCYKIHEADFWECKAPEGLSDRSFSVVSGKTMISEEREWALCSSNREHYFYNTCGTKGKWFEPKE